MDTDKKLYNIFGLIGVTKDEVRNLLIEESKKLIPNYTNYGYIDKFLHTVFEGGTIAFKLISLSCPSIESVIPYILRGSLRTHVGQLLKEKYNIRSAFSLTWKMVDNKNELPENFNELLLRANDGDEKSLDEIYFIFKEEFDLENKQIEEFRSKLREEDERLEKACTQLSTKSENINQQTQTTMDNYMTNQLVIELRNSIEETLQSDEVENKESLGKLLNSLNEYMEENNLEEE
jgi:hypothetical protein